MCVCARKPLQSSVTAIQQSLPSIYSEHFTTSIGSTKKITKLNSSNLKLTVWQLKYKLQSQKSYKTTLIFSSGIKLQYPEHERFLNSGKKKQAATDVNTIKSTHVRFKSLNHYALA